MSLAVRVLAGLVLLTLVGSCGAQQGGGTQQAGAGRSVAGAEKLVACPPATSRPPVANSLPDVTLACLGEGPDIRLADLRGPLLVNIWAQWCGPCREEAPYLAGLARKAGGKVALLGVDYEDPRADLAVKFAVDHQLSYPHLVDADKQLRQPLKIVGPPLTAFVDADGIVTYVHRGPFKSQQELDDLVKDKLGVRL